MKNVKQFQFGVLVLLLTSILSLFTVISVDADDEDEYELLYSTPDKWLQIWSDHAIDQARCKTIAERVRKAYMFDLKQEAWTNQDLLFKTPLKVRVVQSFKSNILGYAQGPNLFVVKDDYLDDPLSEGTLAHELTHIQDGRQLMGAKLPSFLLEGRALTNGHNYRMFLGQAQNQYDRNMAKSAMSFSSEDATEHLNLVRDTGWDMEAIGTFFVEYMRTQWNGGVPDIHPRTSRVIERIAGGLDFKSAFEKEFGNTFDASVKSFMSYLDKTAKTPQSRLEKTIWQNLGSADTPSSMDDDDDD